MCSVNGKQSCSNCTRRANRTSAGVMNRGRASPKHRSRAKGVALPLLPSGGSASCRFPAWWSHRRAVGGSGSTRTGYGRAADAGPPLMDLRWMRAGPATRHLASSREVERARAATGGGPEQGHAGQEGRSVHTGSGRTAPASDFLDHPAGVGFGQADVDPAGGTPRRCDIRPQPPLIGHPADIRQLPAGGKLPPAFSFWASNRSFHNGLRNGSTSAMTGP